MNIIFECHHCHSYNKHNRDDKDYEWKNPVLSHVNLIQQ